MIAIKVECMKHMPSDCDFCFWFGTRPHPYKGWTDICELTGHCMDDDQPEEWIYSGDGRPKACPLIEVADRKTEPTSSKLEQVEDEQIASKLTDIGNSMVSAVASTMEQLKSKLEDEPQTSCKTCRYGEVDEGYVRCAYYSKSAEQDEPQTDCPWK